MLLAIGKPTRFGALTADEQTRCLDRWLNSALAPLRSASHSVRRLLLAVHYARPEVTEAIGYAGPMHLRSPRVPWDGPLPGVSRPDEPVARGAVELPTIIAPAPLPRGVIPAVSMRADLHRTADVVDIGTGAGGAVTAARLAEAGFEVVVLESGAYRTRADFNEREAELTEQLYADGALRTTDDASVALVQGNTVGGSTTVNWMIMLRTPDFVLEQWAKESGVYGMSPREMSPVFERVEREVHASAVPEDAHSANNRILLDGARSLGWKVSTAQINATNCVRCGFCGVGCRHDAKQSTLVTFVPRALTAGATLHADTHVDRIELRERDSGSGTPPMKRVHATVRDPSSGRPARTLTIDAPIVVVAGGAIGTPALLQRSGLGGGGVGQPQLLPQPVDHLLQGDAAKAQAGQQVFCADQVATPGDPQQRFTIKQGIEAVSAQLPLQHLAAPQDVFIAVAALIPMADAIARRGGGYKIEPVEARVGRLGG